MAGVGRFGGGERSSIPLRHPGLDPGSRFLGRRVAWVSSGTPDQVRGGDEREGLFRSVSFSPSRSEEHTSELQSLMRISYAVFCLNTKKDYVNTHNSCFTTTAKIRTPDSITKYVYTYAHTAP